MLIHEGLTARAGHASTAVTLQAGKRRRVFPPFSASIAETDERLVQLKRKGGVSQAQVFGLGFSDCPEMRINGVSHEMNPVERRNPADGAVDHDKDYETRDGW